MIDVKAVMENKETREVTERRFIVRPLCDSTEAQARRKLLEDFKLNLAKKRVEFQVAIQDNGKTIPVITNEAYCQLDDVFAEVNKVFDKLIGLEKQNIMDGE